MCQQGGDLAVLNFRMTSIPFFSQALSVPYVFPTTGHELRKPRSLLLLFTHRREEGGARAEKTYKM